MDWNCSLVGFNISNGYLRFSTQHIFVSERLKDALTEYFQELIDETIEHRYSMWEQGELHGWAHIYEILYDIVDNVRQVPNVEELFSLSKEGRTIRKLENLGVSIRDQLTSFLKGIISEIPTKKLDVMGLKDLCKEIGVTSDILYESKINIGDFRERRSRIDRISAEIDEILKKGAYTPIEVHEILKNKDLKISPLRLKNRLYHLVKSERVLSRKIDMPGNPFNLYSSNEEMLHQRFEGFEKFRVYGEMLTPRQFKIYSVFDTLEEATKTEIIEALKEDPEFDFPSVKIFRSNMKYNLAALRKKGLISLEKRGNEFFYSRIDVYKESQDAGLDYVKLRNLIEALVVYGKRLNQNDILDYGVEEEQVELYADFILKHPKSLCKRMSFPPSNCFKKVNALGELIEIYTE